MTRTSDNALVCIEAACVGIASGLGHYLFCLAATAVLLAP